MERATAALSAELKRRLVHLNLVGLKLILKLQFMFKRLGKVSLVLIVIEGPFLTLYYLRRALYFNGEAVIVHFIQYFVL